MEILFILIALVLGIVACVRAASAHGRADRLERQVTRLELELELLKASGEELATPAPETAPTSSPEPAAPTGWSALEELKASPVAPSVPPPLPVFAPVAEIISAPAEVPVVTETFASESAAPASEPPPVAEKSSFEMRLGTYWLVRVGIVMLLTGLVFFGNFAYHNFIGKLGPGGKVSLLYLASAALLGAGAWWQRKNQKPALQNYAQVLFAGGLAAVYFTTYAAHHLPQLRIIENATLDGALLLAWAGVMTWIADRRRSEPLAFFAIGLAYYTSVITHVGTFTLYSNLLLTVVALVFLVRHRWATLSVASLIGTYAGYAFWRFFQDGDWRWATPGEGLWFGAAFLASYWLVFTVAVFWAKAEKLVNEMRSLFITLNNGAFFALFLLTMLQVNSGGFWKFSLGYGAVLLALAALAKKLLPAEPLAKNSYLTQGLLLVTLGFISKFAGLKLALVLGVESVTLYVLGTQRSSRVLKFGGFIAALLATGWGLCDLEKFDERGLWLGAALGALMVVNAVWAHRQDRADESVVRVQPSYFALLALLIWLVTTLQNTSAPMFPLVLAVEAVALTLSIYWLRTRELVLFGQSFLLIAQVVMLARYLDAQPKAAWWQPALLIGVTLGLSHWWQRQKFFTVAAQLRSAWQGFYALAIVGVLHVWLQPLVSLPVWLALTSLLAVGITAYGVATRAWLLAACGQIFLLVSAGQFALQILREKPDWYFPLAPMAALGLLSLAVVRWFVRRPDSGANVREPLLLFAMIYRWVALAMSVWWVCEYAPARERAWLLFALGGVLFALAGWRRNREILLASAAYAASGLTLFWLRPHGEPLIYLPNLLAILALLAQQQIARRLPARFNLEQRWHTLVIGVGCASLWWFVSRWVCQRGGGFYLTVTWSALALALFGVGIALRERIYRWVGLAILAASLGRVVLFDVWKQETIYRVLTFMALGVVLLVLGFLYNKYQEKIREWL